MKNWEKDKEKNTEKYKETRYKNKLTKRFYNHKLRKLKPNTVKVGNWTFDVEDFKL